MVIEVTKSTALISYISSAAYVAAAEIQRDSCAVSTHHLAVCGIQEFKLLFFFRSLLTYDYH